MSFQPVAFQTNFQQEVTVESVTGGWEYFVSRQRFLDKQDRLRLERIEIERKEIEALQRKIDLDQRKLREEKERKRQRLQVIHAFESQIESNQIELDRLQEALDGLLVLAYIEIDQKFQRIEQDRKRKNIMLALLLSEA